MRKKNRERKIQKTKTIIKHQNIFENIKEIFLFFSFHSNEINANKNTIIYFENDPRIDRCKMEYDILMGETDSSQCQILE